MAIDSAEKRRSISGIGMHFSAPGVTPNASKDAEWRAEAAWTYSGISIAAPVGGVMVGPVIRYARMPSGVPIIVRL